MLGPMSLLRSFLDVQGPGRVDDVSGLIERLEPVWPDLVGPRDEAMEPRKLDRMENPEWMPPRLTFVVERHGALVKGGTRAELQTWVVDLESRTATCAEGGHRQLRPRAAPLDVEPLVTEVVRLVVEDIEDRRLKWSADRATVHIAVGRIIPAEGPKQTLLGRRRRFRARLEDAMGEAGWVETSPGTYVRRAHADAGAAVG